MNKVAVVLLADTEQIGDLGRAVDALQTVKEFQEGGDDVRLVFDGAGTRWVAELSREDHDCHALFETVKDRGTVPALTARPHSA